jgi:hypothetical protein
MHSGSGSALCFSGFGYFGGFSKKKRALAGICASLLPRPQYILRAIHLSAKVGVDGTADASVCAEKKKPG